MPKTAAVRDQVLQVLELGAIRPSSCAPPRQVCRARFAAQDAAAGCLRRMAHDLSHVPADSCHAVL